MLFALWIAGTLAASPAMAQQVEHGARTRVRGTVLAASGKPWSGASVVFMSALAGVSLPVLDTVRVRSDSRGRFQAMLIPGNSYVAWAHSEPVDGHYLCTKAVRGVTGGDIVRLRQEPLVCRQATLTLREREAWKDREPLRFALVGRVRPWARDGDAIVFPIEFDAKRRARLPAMPRVETRIEAYGNDGSPVMVRPFDLPSSIRGSAELSLSMPKRYGFLIRVVPYPGQGTDFSGAQVWQRIFYGAQRGGWMLAGRVRKSGYARLSITVPSRSVGAASSYVYLRVHGERVAMAHFGKSIRFARLVKRDLDKLEQAGKPDQTVKVYSPGCRVRGRVVFAGKPLAKLPLLLYVSLGNPQSRSSYLNFAPERLETDAQGRFSSVGWGPRFGYRLCAVLDAEQRRLLGSTSREPMHPIAWLGVGVAQGDLDLGDVDLQALGRVNFTVRRPDGFPAAHAEIVIGERGDFAEIHTGKKNDKVALATSLPQHFVTSQVGRLSVLVADTKLLGLAAIYDGGFVVGQLKAEPGVRVQDLELRVPASFLLVGRITTQAGTPVAGALVRANVLGPSSPGRSRFRRMLAARVVVTDAQGMYRIGLPSARLSYYLSARLCVDGRWYSSPGRNVFLPETGASWPQRQDLQLPLTDAQIGRHKAKTADAKTKDK